MYLTLRNHGYQGIHGTARSRHDHQATGVFVEAVHDAGTRQHHGLRIQGQQSVEQGATPVAWRRMYHQACGLEQHAQVFVFVNHIQWDVFWLEGLALRRGLQDELITLTHAHLGRSLGHDARRRNQAAHTAFAEQLLRETARELGQQHSQRAVEAFAVQVIGNGEFAGFYLGSVDEVDMLIQQNILQNGGGGWWLSR